MYLNDTIKTCEKRPLNKLIFNSLLLPLCYCKGIFLINTSNILIMHTKATSSFLYLILPVTILFFSITSLAQNILKVDSLSKNTFSWTQKEKEFGFANFDEVFKTHDVPKGKKVHILPRGTAIAAFNKGGQKEKELDSFIAEQKVAGIRTFYNTSLR